jgi:hypothetical protein
MDEIIETSAELTIMLRKPVELGPVTYSELQLREPTADEWVQCAKVTNGAESDRKLVSLVSGMPEAAVGKVGMRDFLQATRYLERFLA